MRVKVDYKIAVIVILLAVIAIFINTAGPELGFATNLSENFITLLPALFVFAVGVIIIATTKGVWAMGGIAALGLSLVYLIVSLNDISVLIPEITTSTFTISDLQLLVLVFTTLSATIALALD